MEERMDDPTDELFCDLMELPPGERAAALDAMADVPAGRKLAVLGMLRQAEDAEAYFTGVSAAVKMLPVSSRAEGVRDMCGPYRLVRKLGEGGFGVVWLAEQEKPLRRTVALKVIKAGMDSEEVLARFEAEKEAIARMEHPNIAKVLDAGMTEYGRPYFAMELVEGETITSFSEERGLDLHERLRLFADVCSALNHAHQKGVIHRDIKPSNVLVMEGESRPVVKVIDFGIAKAIDGQLTDHTLRTRAEQWIGTPAYMSPEQAGITPADPDTRSDIYSLGVLLYELITGVAPFDSATLMKAGYEEMRRIIREEEPPRPSVRITTAIRDAADGVVDAKKSTVKRASSELDWIVMKAMEKAKERRYESASALAGDVARYLSDEPIEARPPSSWYLLGKFARRHRLGIHIASAFLVLIVGAALLSFWFALRAHDAEKIARERLAAALEDRNAKNRALGEAESVSRLLADVFQSPQHGVDGRKVTVLEALDSAAEELETRLASQPMRQAMLRGVLADTYGRLGIYERSFILRKRNFEFHREHSSPRAARAALRELVEAAEATGDSAVALEYARLETELLREADAESGAIEISLRSVVQGLFGVGERAAAIERQRELVDFCTRSFGVDSQPEVKAKWELRQYVASTRATGQTAAGLPEISGLEKDYVAALEANGVTHPKTIDARLELAKALISDGQTLQALIHLKALQALTMQGLGPQDERTIQVHRSLVGVYVRMNRMDDAARAQEVVVSAVRERDGAAAGTTVAEENYLERRLFYSGFRKEHVDYKKDLLRRRLEHFGKDHVNTVMLQLQIPAASEEESLANMQNAIRVMRETYGGKSRSTAEAIAAVARMHAAKGNIREAIKHYAECGPNALDDTWLNFECASFQLWTGDLEGFRKTRSLILGRWAARAPAQKTKLEMFERAVWLASIAELDDGRQEQAIGKILDHLDHVRLGLHVEPTERHGKPTQKEIRGAALYRLGRYGEALASFREAGRVRNPHQPDPAAYNYKHPPHWAVFFTAMAEHRLGNEAGAKKLFRYGESRIGEDMPSRENPLVEYFIGGEALTHWILHSEAKSLIFPE